MFKIRESYTQLSGSKFCDNSQKRNIDKAEVVTEPACYWVALCSAPHFWTTSGFQSWNDCRSRGNYSSLNDHYKLAPKGTGPHIKMSNLLKCRTYRRNKHIYSLVKEYGFGLYGAMEDFYWSLSVQNKRKITLCMIMGVILWVTAPLQSMLCNTLLWSL